ncbi:hypothetical protein ACFU5B_37325 [Streptomyces murinus]|uniref:hypothetical protein n=1 Tax=Streptomyces murinus TaxID=33900 RepID=UPI00363BC605
MKTSMVVSLAGTAAGHERTLLGHDFDAWCVAGILAAIAAVAYEIAMALLRQVTLRIPFLVLCLARLTTPQEEWNHLSPCWKGELWSILSEPPTRSRLVRFWKGISYAAPLAFGAARATAKAAAATPPATEKPSRLVMHIHIRTPSVSDWLHVGLIASCVWGTWEMRDPDLGTRILIAGPAIAACIGKILAIIDISYEEDPGPTGHDGG